MAEARELYSGQGGQLLYGGGSWRPGIPSLVQDKVQKYKIPARNICYVRKVIVYKPELHPGLLLIVPYTQLQLPIKIFIIFLIQEDMGGIEELQMGGFFYMTGVVFFKVTNLATTKYVFQVRTNPASNVHKTWSIWTLYSLN